ncbi:MAG: low molecular weight phosphotyrosine protein phosphatase [Muribaculaceae bacterium]|nr:low molecular weight phosphotyrosine protein phosphatase [Muribaculaceae bacterium]MDE5972166.1 low molecular weight phosphotyrosine protein phosphatase [Muribaculaceae bacterium]MDE6462589.1 low molecular weight phosphotyrosine protein phosphatase [Muribaculaceae bacterium]
MDKTKILFVCLGNICRSPAAEEVMRSLVAERGLDAMFELDSAGISGYHSGELPDKRMRVHALRRGYGLTHRSRQVSAVDFPDFDLIIGMDAANLSALRGMAPSVEDARKIHAMAEYFPEGCAYDHVPDPYYEGAEGFELVLDLLEDSCRRLLDSLS